MFFVHTQLRVTHTQRGFRSKYRGLQRFCSGSSKKRSLGNKQIRKDEIEKNIRKRSCSWSLIWRRASSLYTAKTVGASPFLQSTRWTNENVLRRPFIDRWDVKYDLPQECYLCRDDEYHASLACCASTDSCFESNNILRFIIRWKTPVDSIDWIITCSAVKLMHGNF